MIWHENIYILKLSGPPICTPRGLSFHPDSSNHLAVFLNIHSGIMVFVLNLTEGCLGGHLLIFTRLEVTFVLAIFSRLTNLRVVQF